MKVHVTGGSGFTGQFVIRELAARGHTVYALARSPNAAASIEGAGATPVTGDLDAPETLTRAFSHGDPEVLVNVASLGFGHAPAIIAAAEAAGLQRGVFVSTTAITTALNAPSKAVRIAAEEAVKCSSLVWTIIRPTMIYGTPGDRNIWRLLCLLTRTPVVPLPGGGRRLQQPVHVEDLADAIVCAAERDVAAGRTYDIAGPEPLTFRELVTQAADAVGKSPRIVALPLGATLAVARAYERVAPRPRIKAEQIERLAEDKRFDIQAAVRDLDYHPRSFLDGVRGEAAVLRR